jgi:hypothetical protein
MRELLILNFGPRTLSRVYSNFCWAIWQITGRTNPSTRPRISGTPAFSGSVC